MVIYWVSDFSQDPFEFLYRSQRSSKDLLPNADQKTITLSGVRLAKLEKKFETEKLKRPRLTFTGFITEAALMELERQNLLQEAQFISFIGENNGIITLKDFRKKEKFVEVQIKENDLVCLSAECGSDCIHVGFALALPEIRKQLKKK